MPSDLRLNDGDVLLRGVGELDHAVAPLDLPRQAVDYDLHDRAAARVGHDDAHEGERLRHECSDN